MYTYRGIISRVGQYGVRLMDAVL